MPITLKQPNGTIVECLISGDEFYQRLHDFDNFTILQDVDGYYYYAKINNNKVTPSNIKVNENPLLYNLTPNIKISKIDYLNRRNEYFQDVEERDAPSIGTLNNLNVFIRFADEEEFVTPRSVYDQPFNNDDGPSMKHYFKEVSYNLLTVNTVHYPECEFDTNLSYQDEYPRDYYKPYNETTNPSGYQNNNQARVREHTLLQNAIEFISDQVPVDLDIDANNDGYVDNVTFLVSGAPTGWSDLLWPHRWALYSYDVYINGSRVYDYNLNLDQGGYFTVGTLSHEFFHSLGGPDLYHYYDDVAPVAVGGWDVMDASSEIPQSMCAYMKYKYTDWIEELPVINYGGTYSINPLSNPENNIYRINSPVSNNEYFVVEYRVKEGIYEVNTPGDDNGLLIYRINSSLNGNANGPPDEVYLYRFGGTLTSSGSFGAAVFSQETGRTKFNDTTNPSSFLTDGSTGGINISYVGNADGTIQFSLTNLIIVPELNNISYDSDEDGNINPGEEVILDLSLINLSNNINASNLTATLSTDANITINNPVIEFNDITLEPNNSITGSFVLNIDELIQLGDHDLILNIEANYVENNQNLHYQSQSSHTINVNLTQNAFPYFTSSEVLSTPTAIDLNNDGNKEIFFADQTGFIRMLDINGNEINNSIFPYETGNQIWGSPAIADINNDMINEIIFTSKDKKIYAFTYNELLFEYDASSWLIGTPAIANIDNDDYLEIVFGGFSSSNKKLFAINHDGSDVNSFPIDINEKIQKGVSLYDFNNNNRSDIVFGTESKNIFLIYDDGTIAEGFPFLTNGKIRTETLIIDNNNNLIIVAATDEGTLYYINDSGEMLFNYDTNYEITTSPSITLIDNIPHVVIGNSNGDVYAFDFNGNINQNFSFNLENSIIGSVLFSDLDNDNYDEFIIFDELGYLHILNNNLSYYNNCPIKYDFSYSSSPSIEDIDNDGDLEILGGTVNSLNIIDIKQQAYLNDSWNIFRGNNKRTGVFKYQSCNLGDLNNDNIINIIDVVAMINLILETSNPNESILCYSDMNQSGDVNIQDIILLINIILEI